MDFMNRNVQPSASGRTAPAAGAVSANNGDRKDRGGDDYPKPKWVKLVWIVLLFAGTILLVSALALLVFGNTKRESSFIDKEKFQAVFLENGQVYFGKVRTVNDSYMDLQGIYYLSVDQPVQPEQEGNAQQGNVTLQKLGCELHGPVDQMVINRDHITFWENLRTDGQVSKAIAQWLEQNPDGLKCAEPQQQQNNNSGNGNGNQNGNTNNNESEEQQ